MCRVLEVSRSYYYKVMRLKNSVSAFKKKQNNIDAIVKIIFNNCFAAYGSRKIAKIGAKHHEIQISRYKVSKSMKRQGLECKYNTRRKNKKPYKIDTNYEETENLVKQNFEVDTFNKIVTSDLTYISNKKGFYYICFILDLYNREIVGHSVSEKHDTATVIEAINSGSLALDKLSVFHSDRGGEFKGQELVSLLEGYNVKRSLSKPGCPHDNSPSEKLFDIFKVEWKKKKYDDIIELKKDVDEFVKWYNYFRIHGSIDYQTPVEKRLNHSH